MSERRLTSLDEVRALVGEPHPVTVAKIGSELDATAIAFIARSPFLVLSTVDADGTPQASPKGDEPGFVRVVDARTLLVPERKGNRLIMGLTSLLANPRVSLLFMVPGTGETLRVEGEAELVASDTLAQELSARGQPALLAIRVRVTRVFFHCARAFKRSRLWEPETWPPELRVSFGDIIAGKLGRGADVAAQIDARVQDGYRNEL